MDDHDEAEIPAAEIHYEKRYGHLPPRAATCTWSAAARNYGCALGVRQAGTWEPCTARAQGGRQLSSCGSASSAYAGSAHRSRSLSYMYSLARSYSRAPAERAAGILVLNSMDDGAELRDRLDSVLAFLASDCASKEGLSADPACTCIITDHSADSLLASSRCDSLPPITSTSEQPQPQPQSQSQSQPQPQPQPQSQSQSQPQPQSQSQSQSQTQAQSQSQSQSQMQLQAQAPAAGSIAADAVAHGASDRSFVDPYALPPDTRTTMQC